MTAAAFDPYLLVDMACRERVANGLFSLHCRRAADRGDDDVVEDNRAGTRSGESGTQDKGPRTAPASGA
jgi:hypothetical protein